MLYGHLDGHISRESSPVGSRTMKAAPETMEITRLFIWESPEATIIAIRKWQSVGVHRLFRRFPACVAL